MCFLDHHGSERRMMNALFLYWSPKAMRRVTVRNSKISVAFNCRIFTHTLCTSQTGRGFAPHHFHCGAQADGSICNFPSSWGRGKREYGEAHSVF